jgi:hypothetical protein
MLKFDSCFLTVHHDLLISLKDFPMNKVTADFPGQSLISRHLPGLFKRLTGHFFVIYLLNCPLLAHFWQFHCLTVVT